nr:hypothetical protein [Halomonas sp.]
MKDLSTSDQQMVEIAQAITRDMRVLIMNKPTEILTENAVKVLFALIGRRRWRPVGGYLDRRLNTLKQLKHA